jgi:hypothetical protein
VYGKTRGFSQDFLKDFSGCYISGEFIMRGIEPTSFDPMILVQKGPAQGSEEQASYEFYSTEPGAKIDPSVWGKTPEEVIHKLEVLFAQQEPRDPSEEDWGI